MATFVSENVATEKVDAMRRFERRRIFLEFFPAIEALVAGLLLLYWLTSSVFTGEYLRCIISTGAGIYIFGVVNVLIALIFSLSNHQKIIEPDVYSQYLSSSAASPVNGLSSSSSSSASPVGGVSSSAAVSKSSTSDNEEKNSEGKSGTDCTSFTLTAEGEARPMRREMVRAVSCVASTSQITATNHQVYRRSRSERLDVRGDIYSRRSMRRMCDIDLLNSDEFRSTVETFIARKKKMLSSNIN